MTTPQGAGKGAGSELSQARPPFPVTRLRRLRLTQLMKEEEKLKELLRGIRAEIRKEIEEIRKECKTSVKP